MTNDARARPRYRPSAVISAPAPVGPPFKTLQANFATGLTPRQTSYADLIEIADLGRRCVGRAPDQDGVLGQGLLLDDDDRLCIAPELEAQLVSVSAFHALSQDELAEIWDILRLAGFSETSFERLAGASRSLELQTLDYGSDGPLKPRKGQTQPNRSPPRPRPNRPADR